MAISSVVVYLYSRGRPCDSIGRATVYNLLHLAHQCAIQGDPRFEEGRQSSSSINLSMLIK